MRKFQRGYLADVRVGADPAPTIRAEVVDPDKPAHSTPVRFLLRWLVLAGFATLILLVQRWGGLVATTKLEVDVFHLMDAIERISLGQRMHIDFSSPMGDLTPAVGALWRAQGLPFGATLTLANWTVAMIAALLATWAWTTRVGGAPGLLLGAFGTMLAMQYGWRLNENTLSYAMAYNRWSWALAMPTLTLFLMPSTARGPRADLIDGVAIGFAGGALFWFKANFAAGLFPIWALWAVLFASRRAMRISFLAGLGWTLAIPMLIYLDPLAPFTSIPGYVRDLFAVAASPIRPEQVLPFSSVIGSPQSAMQNIAIVVAMLALIAGGLKRMAAMWGLAFACVTVLTWQNYFSEPFGAFAFAACLPAAALLIHRASPALKIGGYPGANVVVSLSAIFVVMGLQHAIFMERSMLAAFRVKPTDTIRPLAFMNAGDMVFEAEDDGLVGLANLAAPAARAGEPKAPAAGAASVEQELDARQSYLLGLRGARTIAGREFSDCSLSDGWYSGIAQLREAWAERPDLQGRTVMAADVVNVLWMFLQTTPQKGAQIWLYNKPGDELEQADLLAVNTCPWWRTGRNMILDEAKARGLVLTPELETDLWGIYRVSKP